MPEIKVIKNVHTWHLSLFTYLSVENPLLEINKVVITKKEVEVLEGFCEKERSCTSSWYASSFNLKIYQSDVVRVLNT